VIFNRQTRRIADPTTVVVPRADLPGGGWVVIHDGDHRGHGGGGGDDDGRGGGGGGGGDDDGRGGGGGGGGGHGDGHHDHGILGVEGPLDPGHYGELKVALFEPPEPGPRTLTAMLHRDTRAGENFEHDENHDLDPHYGPPEDRAVAEVTFREAP
jgi:hypothetical protein